MSESVDHGVRTSVCRVVACVQGLLCYNLALWMFSSNSLSPDQIKGSSKLENVALHALPLLRCAMWNPLCTSHGVCEGAIECTAVWMFHTSIAGWVHLPRCVLTDEGRLAYTSGAMALFKPATHI